MDSGKQMIFEDRRKKAAMEVTLKRTAEHTFNVVDEEGNFKYKVSTVPGKEDCECPSFVNNNTKKHDDATGQFFLCKHIYAAQYVESLEETIKENSTHTKEMAS